MDEERIVICNEFHFLCGSLQSFVFKAYAAIGSMTEPDLDVWSLLESPSEVKKRKKQEKKEEKKKKENEDNTMIAELAPPPVESNGIYGPILPQPHRTLHKL